VTAGRSVGCVTKARGQKRFVTRWARPLFVYSARYNTVVSNRRQDEGGSLLFSAWVATVLLVVIPPLWIALLLTRSRERSMRLLRRWARHVITLCGCSLRIRGLQHLERGRCAIIVANHASYLDSVVLLAVIPAEYRFVANHGELARPFVGLVLRRGHHLIVDRRSIRSREACIRAMLTALHDGTSLVLFPEGTRSADQLLAFKNGAFRAAIKSGRPIIPVVIAGTSHILPRQFRLLRRGPIEISILPAIDPEGVSRDAAALRQQTREAMARVVNGLGC
jgi:fatty-acyl-CoA synthase